MARVYIIVLFLTLILSDSIFALTFVHIADTHIGGAALTQGTGDEQFIATIAEINAMNPQPDFVVIAGDCTHNGIDSEFTTYKNLENQFLSPPYSIDGNRDRKDDPEEVLFEQYVLEGNETYYSFDAEGYHFIFLGSGEGDPYQSDGHLDQDVLTWLSNDLSAVDLSTPIIIFTHHAEENLDNAANLKDILENNGFPFNVKAWFAGHEHANEDYLIWQDVWPNLRQIVTNSTWYSWDGDPLGYSIVELTGSTIDVSFQELCSNALIRNINTSNEYYSLQEAYDEPLDDKVLHVRDLVLTEDLIINEQISVTFQGGYDCAYSSNTGRTSVYGTITINDGAVTFENFELK